MRLFLYGAAGRAHPLGVFVKIRLHKKKILQQEKWIGLLTRISLVGLPAINFALMSLSFGVTI